MPPASKKRRVSDTASSANGRAGNCGSEVETGATSSGTNPGNQSVVSEAEAIFLKRIEQSRKNWGSPLIFPFKMERVRQISEGIAEDYGNCVAYWMSRDCRVQDNWAFIYAQRIALQRKLPLHVVFCLTPVFGHATLRAYKFLLGGLCEVQTECLKLNIPFHLLIGYAKDVLPSFMQRKNCKFLVCDFNPLKAPLEWIADVKERIGNAWFSQVDAHNIVPCWVASDKEEIGARTIRSKIQKLLDQYHTAFPPILPHPHLAGEKSPEINWEAAEASLAVDRSVDAVDWAKPGTKNGLLALKDFLYFRLKNYLDRNDPNVDAQSMLSPWFHFGQVSVARTVLEGRELVKNERKLKPSFDAYFEEAVIRRELSDNFCFYNSDYDNINGAKPWAKSSLDLHLRDKRPVTYTLKDLEEGRTHDDLWNASQMQMVHDGKLHGFLRMYWAKKILEWTENPSSALQFAILLNDKYNLDGRDPNGYVGCMWSICGIHDQGWKERNIFGKIRYMNYQGCLRKFDVAAFVDKYRKYFPASVSQNVTY